MRLKRGVAVAGVEPEVARALARGCHDNWSPASWISRRAKVDPGAVVPLLECLADGGYLQRRPAELYPEEGLEWNTTLAGGALTPGKAALTVHVQHLARSALTPRPAARSCRQAAVRWNRSWMVNYLGWRNSKRFPNGSWA